MHAGGQYIHKNYGNVCIHAVFKQKQRRRTQKQRGKAYGNGGKAGGEHRGLILMLIHSEAHYCICNADGKNGYEQISRLHYKVGYAVLLRRKDFCIKRREQQHKQL